jgi:tetrahydromethanopterin S-methyltransferase subunit B
VHTFKVRESIALDMPKTAEKLDEFQTLITDKYQGLQPRTFMPFASAQRIFDEAKSIAC